MSTCHAMGGHGWTWFDANGHGPGMGTNSKGDVGLCSKSPLSK